MRKRFILIGTLLSGLTLVSCQNGISDLDTKEPTIKDLGDTVIEITKGDELQEKIKLNYFKGYIVDKIRNNKSLTSTSKTIDKRNNFMEVITSTIDYDTNNYFYREMEYSIENGNNTLSYKIETKVINEQKKSTVLSEITNYEENKTVKIALLCLPYQEYSNTVLKTKLTTLRNESKYDLVDSLLIESSLNNYNAYKDLNGNNYLIETTSKKYLIKDNVLNTVFEKYGEAYEKIMTYSFSDKELCNYSDSIEGYNLVSKDIFKTYNVFSLPLSSDSLDLSKIYTNVVKFISSKQGD